MHTKWSLLDFIFLALISIFFGFIFCIWAFAYNAIAAVLTPLGLSPFANDATLGPWLMAGPMAGYILRRPGASIIGETLAGIVEMVFGSQWGIMDIVAGAIQGLGTEIGFAAFRYRRWDKTSLSLSVLTSTIVTFIWDLFRNGYLHYTLLLLIALFITRLISVTVFSGVIVYFTEKLISKSAILSNNKSEVVK
ncbi:ABC transporter permease [Oenococcus oeni]|uniref:ECF transporter S component n=1 Tax=Oenococcus oeni TaxID=1247 RepID=UPI0008F8456C|nr:ECF transporter S component [Oenococcus oeni]OIM70824.1 ABC transporter permease [Oenococcus oeni]OLQ41660.1 ABC transporter permease [Oenococcus oeni]